MFIANAVAIGLLVLLWVGRDDLGKHVFQRVPYSSNSGFTTDMRPVELELVDRATDAQLKLRVPKAYLTSVRNWSGGRQQ